MTTRRTFTKAMALSPLMLSQFPGAFAQAKYPAKPITMIVGFPPGQSSDIGARNIAKQMSEILKQSIIVDNKPGAATIIGHQALKAATRTAIRSAIPRPGRSRSIRRFTRSCLTIRRSISSRSSCSTSARCFS